MGLIKDIKDELEELILEGKTLLDDYIKNHKKGDAHKMNLHSRYHIWYSKAALVVEQTLSFRHNEFVSYFEPSSKRKELNVLSYTISDFILGITKKYPSGKRSFRLVCRIYN